MRQVRQRITQGFGTSSIINRLIGNADFVASIVLKWQEYSINRLINVLQRIYGLHPYTQDSVELNTIKRRTQRLAPVLYINDPLLTPASYSRKINALLT